MTTTYKHKRKNTTRAQQRAMLANYITEAKHLSSLISKEKTKMLKPGSTFTQQELLDFMAKLDTKMKRTKHVLPFPNPSTLKEHTRNSLKILNMYTTINKALVERGLVIKAQNYYSEFHVLDANEVQGQVNEYQKNERIQGKCKVNLTNGVANHNLKWKALVPRERTIVAHRLKYGN
jgi:hypothetical protein